MIKKCSKCGEEKPATLEYFSKRSSDKTTGLHPHCKECNKAYYEAKKESILKQRKAYREANKGDIAEYLKAYYRTPKGRWRRIKSSAKERGINFSLPFKLYESQLWGKPCHYCGCEIEVTGLDRKDNDKGYTPDNVVPCCGLCNSKKETKPYQVFIEEMINE